MCKNCYDSGICVSCEGTGMQLIGSVESDLYCPECGGTGACDCCMVGYEEIIGVLDETME